MKTVQFFGVHDVRATQAQKPAPKSNEALIKVSYAGICGSDMHIYNKGMFVEHIPEIMGHEFVGIIESVGEQVKNFKPGDYVVGNPMITCGKCCGCENGFPNTCSGLVFIGEARSGCFAEYIALEEDKLISVPCTADLRNEALTEPLAVALNLCERANLRPNDKLAIIGTGTIGLLTLLVAKQLYSVENVTCVGRSDFRKNAAKKLGADFVLSALDEKSAAEGTTQRPRPSLYDKVMETAGQQETLRQAIANVKPCGTVCVVSVFEDLAELDINDIVVGQKTLTGCNTYLKRHLEQAANLIAQGKIDVSPLITAVMPLERAGEAFAALAEKDKKQIKILLKP